MTRRVLCDTNVLVSAVIAGGPPSRIIDASIDGHIELVLADPVIDELERVLTLKLGFEPERVRNITALLIDIAAVSIDAPTQPVEAITGDPDDDVVLACGIRAGVQIIVSGDRRHMLPIREHRGIRIVSPQALLAELAGATHQSPIARDVPL
ncbi:MAG TPA: putative toxin-antitoxin system toxin component, PIN family [Solirubrobacteraceae bacterium]|nr:putative toxin-antitoxin system toxin component, PIN family [Solirubrobacteraceae bacterium]